MDFASPDNYILATSELRVHGQISSTGWIWDPTPLDPGRSQPDFGLTPYTVSRAHDKPLPEPPYLFSSSCSSQDIATAAPKVPIPRATGTTVRSQRRRTARACEPCRQHKTKCDGNKPVCTQCLRLNMRCKYSDTKRVRDQKKLGLLTRKVVRYENLLEEIERESEWNTARRISQTLRMSDQISPAEDDSCDGFEHYESFIYSKDTDIIKESLTQNNSTDATGSFGKTPKVSRMQRLKDEAGQQRSDESADYPHTETPMLLLSHDIDNIGIPLSEDVDPYVLPEKDVADRFFSSYMDHVHSSFMVLRRVTFTEQYHQAWFSRPPRRWLAILNLIFAIGCRYYRFTSKGGGGHGSLEELVYLNRACKLSLNENVLLEFTDLQQVQVETLAALYLFISGQVNRASRMSSLALRSALTLGINLRSGHRRLHHACGEARSRLWWSVYLLEHLITRVNGHASSVGEVLSTTLLPIPCEEEHYSRPEIASVIQDPALKMAWLKKTLFQTCEERLTSASRLATYEPSASLIFHCEVDLATIAQTILSTVSNSQAPGEHPSRCELCIHRFNHTLDSWRAKLPQSCRFTESAESDRLRLNGESADFFRDKVRLALEYYSSRIILYQPYLSMKYSHLRSPSRPQSRFRSSTRDRNCSNSTAAGTRLNSSGTYPNISSKLGPGCFCNGSRSRLHAEISIACLRSACSLVDIFPGTPDMIWLSKYTTWWSVSHFLTQAITVLVHGVFQFNPGPDLNGGSMNGTLISSAILDDRMSRTQLLASIWKASQWLHAMSQINPAAKHASALCNSYIRRIAPAIDLHIKGFPDREGLSDCSTGGKA
ncbi:uncharacterized transcriptional regulatory protein C3C7.04 [Aspergillus awamori]|uniref:Uncharacterized transcriptional regulatory protein C3C7.04 n=1 Tax=Aspergillus awamori TaxID=105351 RepID=A0A401KZ82_ASPAW|nr:uncharacterized transcriptional regulatory protein C3C7.04 [Aspergillus awamori]GKZ63426.1 hypothetical protein AnigIFM49718_011834 [Aspergillus niger]